MDCVNQVIPNRTKHEHYIQNKDIVSTKNKENYIQNKDIILTKSKEHYIQNKDEILQKRKEYRNKHKDEISEKRKEKRYTCACGSECRVVDKSIHEKRIKHLVYLKNQAILVDVTSNPDTR